MKLILSLCSIALFSSCSGGYSSPSGLAASTGSSVKFTLTPQNTLTNTSVVVQSATLSSDGTGTLSVLESGTVDTINFTYTFDSGDFTKIRNGEQVTVASSVVASATSQVSGIQPKIQPQVSSINGYVKFIFKGAYYSVKAYFKATDSVGGATLAQAIEDRPNDMQYNGVASVTTSIKCDVTSLNDISVNTPTATLVFCCDINRADNIAANYNSRACQSYRTSSGTTPTPTPTTSTSGCTCVINYTRNGSSYSFTATYSSSNGYSDPLDSSCTSSTCSDFAACETTALTSDGDTNIGSTCN